MLELPELLELLRRLASTVRTLDAKKGSDPFFG
jgi:hypothetical protein